MNKITFDKASTPVEAVHVLEVKILTSLDLANEKMIVLVEIPPSLPKGVMISLPKLISSQLKTLVAETVSDLFNEKPNIQW